MKFEARTSRIMVEAVPGGPIITQNCKLFQQAFPEADFSGPGSPKSRPGQISAGFGLILGPRLGAFFVYFCIFFLFLFLLEWGGLNCNAVLPEF